MLAPQAPCGVHQVHRHKAPLGRLRAHTPDHLHLKLLIPPSLARHSPAEHLELACGSERWLAPCHLCSLPREPIDIQSHPSGRIQHAPYRLNQAGQALGDVRLGDQGVMRPIDEHIPTRSRRQHQRVVLHEPDRIARGRVLKYGCRVTIVLGNHNRRVLGRQVLCDVLRQEGIGGMKVVKVHGHACPDPKVGMGCAAGLGNEQRNHQSPEQGVPRRQPL